MATLIGSVVGDRDVFMCVVATLVVALSGGGSFLLNCLRPKIALTGDNLFGMAVLGYAVPQTWLTFCVMDFRIDAGITVYLMHVVLCNIAFHVGYRHCNSPSRLFINTQINETKFLQVTYIAAIVSFVGWALWFRQVSTFKGRHWNSSLIYLYTLASQSRPAFTFAICGLVFCKKLRGAVIPLLITLVPLTHFAIIGRRSAIFYVLINLIFLATYIFRRKLPSKILALLLPLGIFAFLLIPVYREAFPKGIDAVQQRLEEKPISEALGDFFKGERTIEYYHASRATYATYSSSSYSYGAGFWNSIVFQYFPGGLFGRGLKEELTIQEPDMLDVIKMEYHDASLHRTYLALGAYHDSFKQFSFAGCILFGIFAYVFHGVEKSALLLNNKASLVLLMLCGILPAMLPYFPLTKLMAMLFFPVVLYLIVASYIFVQVPSTPVPSQNG